MRTPSLVPLRVSAAVLLIALVACAPSPSPRAPNPSTAPATQAATQPAIPVVYANKHGTPFKDFPAEELARILARADEMTPPKKKIWFVLIRAGTWFPAAEVYFTPETTEGASAHRRVPDDLEER